MHALHILARIIFGILGLGFGYMALFMYRDTQGKLQNHLVDFWVRVNSMYEEKLSRQSVIVKAAAGVAESGMRWLFGEKMLSLRFILFSASVSVASMEFFQAFLLEGSPRWWVGGPELSLAGMANVIYGSYAARVLVPQKRILKAVGLFLLLQIGFIVGDQIYFYLRNYSYHDNISEYLRIDSFFVTAISYLIGILIGLFCDSCLLMFSRYLIKLTATTKTRSVIWIGICFSAMWFYLQASIILIWILPYRSYVRHNFLFRLLVYLTDDLSLLYPPLLIRFGISSTLFNLLAASSIFIVLCVVLSHRIIWPVLSRVIYAVYQWEVCTNRALQLGASVAFLTFASPWFESVLDRFKP